MPCKRIKMDTLKATKHPRKPAVPVSASWTAKCIKIPPSTEGRRRGGNCAAAAIAPPTRHPASPLAMPAPPLDSLVAPLVRPVYPRQHVPRQRQARVAPPRSRRRRAQKSRARLPGAAPPHKRVPHVRSANRSAGCCPARRHIRMHFASPPDRQTLLPSPSAPNSTAVLT